MICEFICQFSFGSHLYFLTRLPSPSLIAQACTDIRPAIIITVPMVVEKIIRKNVLSKGTKYSNSYAAEDACC